MLKKVADLTFVFWDTVSRQLFYLYRLIRCEPVVASGILCCYSGHFGFVFKYVLVWLFLGYPIIFMCCCFKRLVFSPHSKLYLFIPLRLPVPLAPACLISHDLYCYQLTGLLYSLAPKTAQPQRPRDMLAFLCSHLFQLLTPFGSAH